MSKESLSEFQGHINEHAQFCQCRKYSASNHLMRLDSVKNFIKDLFAFEWRLTTIDGKSYADLDEIDRYFNEFKKAAGQGMF